MDNLIGANQMQQTDTLLQSAIDKNTLAEAQDLISSMQADTKNNNEFDDMMKEEPESTGNESIVTDDLDDYEDELLSLSERFLQNEQLAFNLQPPTIVPNYLNFHYICECGSRILFLSIFWLKKFHPFRLLRYIRRCLDRIVLACSNGDANCKNIPV